MREILFRGKTAETGKWVQGYLCIIPQDNQAPELNIQEYKEHQNGMMREYETTLYAVNPNTVGQYTGLKDKNGTKIFEGDIIRSKYANAVKNEHIEEVVFRGGKFVAKKCIGSGGFYSPIYDGTKHLKIDKSIYMKSFEVIGNIYDNPELLEEE